MLILGLMAWSLAIIVLIYQTLLDFRTGMLNRKVTHTGIALAGIAFAVADSFVSSNLAPLALSLLTGITSYYFFKYTVYRMGLIGGGDTRVMYSLGFMFPTLAELPFLVNNNYLFGIRETWPYLSMYFNLVIIAGFFIIFETLADCWKANKLKFINPDFKYFAISMQLFAISIASSIFVAPGTIASDRLGHLVRALIIIGSFVLGLFFLKRFSKDILRKKLKFSDLPALGHQILSSQYVVELNNGADNNTDIRTVNDADIIELKKKSKGKNNISGKKARFNIIVQKNTIIPAGLARKLASLAPDAEIEIKTAKPRTIYLLIMVLMLPFGDLFTILNKIIVG